MQTPRQNSCPSISQLSPFSQSKDAKSILLHPPSLELPIDNIDDQQESPGQLPLYRTVSAGTVDSRRSSEVTGSLVGYLDDMKDIKKENFDLKLKLFFLEERLGIGIGGESMKKLSDENIELKIQLHQCKLEIANKSSLIKEAINAIDECEKKILHLEDKCQDLVEKGNKCDKIKEKQSVLSQTSCIETEDLFSYNDEYEEFTDEMLLFAEALDTENIFTPENNDKHANSTSKDMSSMENVTLDVTKNTSTINISLKEPLRKIFQESFENSTEANSDDKKEIECVMPTDDSKCNSLIRSVGKLNVIFTKKHIWKTGVFFLSTVFVGFSISKRLRLMKYVQDSMLITSYVANCMFYPINPFIYTNY